MSHRSLLLAVAVLGVGSFAVADEAAMPPHTMLMPDEIKWGEGPPSLPPGGKMAVMLGDPSKPDMYILRAKLPAGYKIPAHWHPTTENITVLSGVFMMGEGDKLDAATAKAYPAGSIMSMPAKQHHFAMTKKETVIEVSGMGPFAITYLDPATDPRNAAAAATTPAKK